MNKIFYLLMIFLTIGMSGCAMINTSMLMKSHNPIKFKFNIEPRGSKTKIMVEGVVRF